MYGKILFKYIVFKNISLISAISLITLSATMFWFLNYSQYVFMDFVFYYNILIPMLLLIFGMSFLFSVDVKINESKKPRNYGFVDTLLLSEGAVSNDDLKKIIKEKNINPHLIDLFYSEYGRLDIASEISKIEYDKVSEYLDTKKGYSLHSVIKLVNADKCFKKHF